MHAQKVLLIDSVPPPRQGAQFVETWVDGFRFMEVSQMQSSISQQREELEKQRKLLAKRKVQATVGGSGSGGEAKLTIEVLRIFIFFLSYSFYHPLSLSLSLSLLCPLSLRKVSWR